MLIYTHCWELMTSVGSHGSLSLPFVMKVMVCHFVSNSHEVMTAVIVMLPLIVVVEISLQLHQSVLCLRLSFDDLHHCIAATKHYILKNQNFAQSYFSVKKRFTKSVVPGV